MKRTLLSMLVLLMGLTLHAQVVKVYKGCPNIPIIEITDADSIVTQGCGFNIQSAPDTADVPENAIHVYEAVDICSKLQSGQSTDSVYRVKGWIVRADSVANAESISKYGNATFYMMDTYDYPTPYQPQFYVLQVCGLNHKKIQRIDAVKEGDYVVVECHLTNYNGVAETVGKSDGFIYSSTNPNIAARPDAINVTCAEAKEIALALSANNTPTTEYYCVTGYITNIVGTPSKGQQTFWMNDTTGTVKTFEGYYANLPDDVTTFTVGQHIKLYGHIMKYNTTPEIKNGDVEFIETQKVSQRKESVIWHHNGNNSLKIYKGEADYPFVFENADSIVFKPKPQTPETYINPVISNSEVNSIVGQGTIMDLDNFVSTYMTEQGNWLCENHPYPQRATSDNQYYVFAVDTIPEDGAQVFIRARIADRHKYRIADWNLTSYVLQQVVGEQQQTIRMFAKTSDSLQVGQEVLIHVNGLAIGRNADQPTLCMPHYFTFTYSTNGEAKCGWRPGQIRPLHRNGKLWLIGQPDASKIMYETMTIADYKSIISKNDKQYRQMDGHMVEINGIHFTGQYESNGKLVSCTNGDPRIDGNANYFAPSSRPSVDSKLMINYPQGRIFTDGADFSLTFCHIWFPIALVQLPAAEYTGSVRGILTFVNDNAAQMSKYGLNQYNWGITIQSVEALDLSNAESKAWEPIVFDPDAE